MSNLIKKHIDNTNPLFNVLNVKSFQFLNVLKVVLIKYMINYFRLQLKGRLITTLICSKPFFLVIYLPIDVKVFKAKDIKNTKGNTAL